MAILEDGFPAVFTPAPIVPRTVSGLGNDSCGHCAKAGQAPGRGAAVPVDGSAWTPGAARCPLAPVPPPCHFPPVPRMPCCAAHTVPGARSPALLCHHLSEFCGCSAASLLSGPGFPRFSTSRHPFLPHWFHLLGGGALSWVQGHLITRLPWFRRALDHSPE